MLPMNASIIGIIICLMLSGLFSSVETAFTSLSVFQIEGMKKKGRNARLVEKLARKPEELISTILIGNNAVNIAASTIAARWALEQWGDWVLGLVSAILTLVILIFGEVSPKRIAINHNEAVAIALAPFLLLSTWLLKPFVLLVNSLSSLITNLFGKPVKGSLSMETMVQMMSLAEHRGVIDYSKSQMVKNVFRLGATTVQAVMTHRIDVFSLDANTKAGEALKLASEAEVSKIPIYMDNSENIIGIVSISDLTRLMLSGNGDEPLSSIMTKPIIILPNKSVGDLFTIFKKRKDTFAVVIDEYGGLAGIVTIMDVLEEIVGEIYEDMEEASRERIVKKADGSYTVSGDAPMALIAEISGGDSPSLPYVQTVAGYIAWALDRIPAPGDRAETALGVFTVSKVEANRVEKAVYKPGTKHEKN